MDHTIGSLPSYSLLLFGLLGMVLIGLSLMALWSRRSGPAEAGPHRELDSLFSQISRGLRALSSPTRAGGLFYREKQEEVGRLLSEMQGRLRLLEDGIRQSYEAKASRVLADAARLGITVPPLESPLISSGPARY